MITHVSISPLLWWVHHHWLVLTSLSSSTNVAALPVAVVPELAIPAEAYPEWINRPSGCKDYLCHLCPFRHSNFRFHSDTHQKTFRNNHCCPICGRGYQNAASLCKHSTDVHNVQIVASTTHCQVSSPKNKFKLFL